MAKPVVLLLGLLLILSSLFTATHATRFHWAQPKQAGWAAGPWFKLGSTTEKTTTITVYVQNFLSGEKQAIYEVATASITAESPTSFGQVRVMDEKVTAGTDFDSEELGRAQGLVTSADFKIVAFAMNINFVFTAGEYKGSTISIAGRNVVNDLPVRELPIIGGTGEFREASGYALTKTMSYDPVTTYGVMEYKFYVSYPDPAPATSRVQRLIDMKKADI